MNDGRAHYYERVAEQAFTEGGEWVIGQIPDDATLSCPGGDFIYSCTVNAKLKSFLRKALQERGKV